MTDDMRRCPACNGRLRNDEPLVGSKVATFKQSCFDCDAEFMTVCDLENHTRSRTDD